MALNECRRWKTRKCVAFAFVLCHLENTPSHINKNRELKQRGRECYKTIDLITEYNHFMWECNHLAHRSAENKRNVGICWAKRLTGFKLDATYANIMQYSPTWCTNESNIFCPTCWHNMLRSFARALRPMQKDPTPNNVVTCCVRLHGTTTMLALVAYSLKPVKLLGPCKRTQHCRPTTPNNVGSCWHSFRPFAWALIIHFQMAEISDVETLSADVVPTTVAITQSMFHKICC